VASEGKELEMTARFTTEIGKMRSNEMLARAERYRVAARAVAAEGAEGRASSSAGRRRRPLLPDGWAEWVRWAWS
jgi:hypothetical protein